jgi:hypothetical protein
MNNPDVFAKEKPHAEELSEANYSIILHPEINSRELLKPCGKLMKSFDIVSKALLTGPKWW